MFASQGPRFQQYVSLHGVYSLLLTSPAPAPPASPIVADSCRSSITVNLQAGDPSSSSRSDTKSAVRGKERLDLCRCMSKRLPRLGSFDERTYQTSGFQRRQFGLPREVVPYSEHVSARDARDMLPARTSAAPSIGEFWVLSAFSRPVSWASVTF
jgi:hypothetical protein